MINGKYMSRLGAVKPHINHRFVMSDPVDVVICLNRVSLVSTKLKIDLIPITIPPHRRCVETSVETTEEAKKSVMSEY